MRLLALRILFLQLSAAQLSSSGNQSFTVSLKTMIVCLGELPDSFGLCIDDFCFHLQSQTAPNFVYRSSRAVETLMPQAMHSTTGVPNPS
jgi:hypothetical protein